MFFFQTRKSSDSEPLVKGVEGGVSKCASVRISKSCPHNVKLCFVITSKCESLHPILKEQNFQT